MKVSWQLYYRRSFTATPAGTQEVVYGMLVYGTMLSPQLGYGD